MVDDRQPQLHTKDHDGPTASDATTSFDAIARSAADAIVGERFDGTITAWNDGAERLFGYSAAEMLGRSVSLLLEPEDVAGHQFVLSEVKRGVAVAPYDATAVRKDGISIAISIAMAAIRDAGGTVIGVSQIARDISSRKRIEHELADVQHRLIALANASSSILGARDVDAVLTATIDLARQVFAADGYALWRGDQMGQWRAVRSLGISEEFAARIISAQSSRGNEVPFAEPLSVEDVQRHPFLADLRDAYIREGIASLIVFPLVIVGARCGTLVFYSRVRRAFRDIDIQVGAALANLAATALTTAELYAEQRTAREAADHARQTATFLAQAATTLSASLDYEATLTAVAQLAVPTVADWCAVHMVGDSGRVERLAVAHVDPQKVALARRLEERYPADPNQPAGLHQVIRNGKSAFIPRVPEAFLDALARDDDHRRLLQDLQITSYMCVPLMARGRAFGAITFVSGESHREYSETDLRFAQELAARASLAVENARAYKRANEANRLKDEFLATLSHELRTPLNAVLGYTSMLRVGTLSAAKTNAALQTIERNASALKQIIEDVLDVSRIVAGRLRLNVAPVDLAAVVREAMASVEPAGEAKGVRMETMLDQLGTAVSGDAERLQQVVWNLLSNAIKFTPRGGKVQVRLRRVDSHVEIAVSDTGRGIDAAFLPFVFDRFTQEDASYAREHGGLGLGLAIAKHLVESHGGSIAVASDGPDRGATFTVKLPLMIVHRGTRYPADSEPAARVGPTPVTTLPRLDGVHVACVDDDPDSLHLLEDVLKSAGAIVTVSNTAGAALEAIGAEPPDVIIADIGMPGMDGFQLMRTIRHFGGRLATVPAAALTAYARSEDRIAALASGFQMHLAKPIDAAELILAVATLARRIS
jgi:PAS domain S-box-containing protein